MRNEKSGWKEGKWDTENKRAAESVAANWDYCAFYAEKYQLPDAYIVDYWWRSIILCWMATKNLIYGQRDEFPDPTRWTAFERLYERAEAFRRVNSLPHPDREWLKRQSS
jgi:hypothetical protein